VVVTAFRSQHFPTQIPEGCCHCGCGEPTAIARKTNVALGYVKGKPRRFVKGHHARTLRRYSVDANGCWIWLLQKRPNGYGIARVGEARRCAHVVVWEEAHGPVPAGLQLDHLCRVRACVNPDHLEAVTPAENVQRGSAAKLTADDVRAIRASDEKHAALARRYGVTEFAIRNARKGGSWKNVEGLAA
jgi:HNH endonuclease